MALNVFRSSRNEELRLSEDQTAALQRFDEGLQLLRGDLLVGEIAVHILDAGLEAAPRHDLTDDVRHGERVLSVRFEVLG